MRDLLLFSFAFLLLILAKAVWPEKQSKVLELILVK